MLTKLEEVQIDTSNVHGNKQLTTDSIHEKLFDEFGQVKTNIGKKAVVSSDTLELLETGGKAVSFEPLSSAKEIDSFENLKLNKSLKLVNTMPHFLSVPATAHLFDLAGSGVAYPEEQKEEGKGRWFGSIGSFFSRKK